MQLQRYKSKCWLAKTWLVFYVHARLYAPVYTLMSLEKVVVYLNWAQWVYEIAKLARHAALAATTHCRVTGVKNTDPRSWSTTITQTSPKNLWGKALIPPCLPPSHFLIDGRPTSPDTPYGATRRWLLSILERHPTAAWCYDQPGRPGAHPAFLPCPVLLPMEECPNAAPSASPPAFLHC